MTVQSQTSRISYAGNGVTLQFAVPFRFLADSHLLVVLRSALGVETTQVLTTNYTVAGARSQSGGAVGMLVAPAAGTTLVITRNVPLTQLIDYKANDPFPEESAEDGLDQLTMALQQQGGKLARALVLFDTDTDGSGRYNANGNRIVSLADGIDPTDAATVQQLTAISSGSFIQSGTGAVIRTMQDKNRDIISALDYMTVAQIADVRTRAGLVDVTAAFQAAVTAAAGKRLYVPGGLYILSAAITAAASPVVIQGDGIGATDLRWTLAAASTGIALTLSASGGLTGTCSVSDLSLVTEKAGLGTPLKITSPASTSADRIQPRAIVQNVMMQGATNPLVDGWLNGIHLSNCSNSTIDSCYFWGKVNGTEPNYTSVSGFIYNNDVSASPHQSALTLVNCIGHYATSMVSVGDCEGVLIDKCQFVGVNKGIVAVGPLAYPHISIGNGHVNASDTCIEISNMQEVFIDRMLLFKELGGSAARGIALLGACKKGRITNNTFDNLSLTAAQTGIFMDDADDFWIEGNSFRKEAGSPAGTGINVSNAACTDNVIGVNRYESGITGISDTGTRTIQPNMRVLLSRSTTKTIVAATPTDVDWTTVDSTSIGVFWAGGNPTRITFPVAGWYIISANIAWGAGAGGNREVFVRKNAGTPAPLGIGRVKNDQLAAGGLKHGFTSTPILFAVGDYVELRVTPSVGDDITATGTTDSWFAAQRVYN